MSKKKKQRKINKALREIQEALTRIEQEQLLRAHRIESARVYNRKKDKKNWKKEEKS